MERTWKIPGEAPQAWDLKPTDALRNALREADRSRPSREARLEELVMDLVQTVRLQAAEIEALKSSSAPRKESPIERWRREHWAELRARAGKTVAIHPERGIVAEGTLSSVLEQVRALGLAREAVIEKVRPVATRQ